MTFGELAYHALGSGTLEAATHDRSGLWSVSSESQTIKELDSNKITFKFRTRVGSTGVIRA